MPKRAPDPQALRARVVEAEAELKTLRARNQFVTKQHLADEENARMLRNLVALMPYAMPRIPGRVLALYELRSRSTTEQRIPIQRRPSEPRPR